MTTQEHTTIDSLDELNDAIHTMAQPLTALSFVLEMGLLNGSPASLRSALEQAHGETLRAIAALKDVRHVAAGLTEMQQRRHQDGGLPWKQPQ